MDRTFKVVGKSLKGSNENPVVVFKNNKGDKLELRLDDESQLNDYEINEILTVKIAKEQQTLT